MTVSILTARNATLTDLHALLEAQHAAKLDVVVPARDLTVAGGNVIVAGAGEAVVTPDGVSPGRVSLRPTSHADANLAAKLDIPIKYLRRLREQHIGLYDHSVNTLLGEDPDYRFLVRALVDGATDQGVGRAFLSSSYRVTDNLDVLVTVLAGIRDAGVSVEITRCDLSETRMYVIVSCRPSPPTHRACWPTTPRRSPGREARTTPSFMPGSSSRTLRPGTGGPRSPRG